jgi:hypothetical protein
MERSTTVSLTVKLGVTEGSSLALLHAPAQLSWSPPASVRVTRRARGSVDVVVAFYTTCTALAREVETLVHLITPAGSLWVSWPKRASGVVTDINDHVARDMLLPIGLVDNKVCAIDDTWTGLRFVWRRSVR